MILGGTKKGYVLGYDLGASFSQISYLSLSESEPKTLSVKTGAQVYDIPTVLAKRRDVNQWFFGREAVKQSTEGNAVPVTDMLEKAIAGESVFVGDEEYDAVSLLALFVKRSLSMLSMEVDATLIRGIMFTCATLDTRMVEVLRGITEALQLPMKHVYFQSYAESLYHYMLSQPKELRAHTVLACDYHYATLRVYALNFNFHTTPVVANIEEQAYSEMEYNLENLPESGSYRDKAYGILDTQFLRIAESLCQGRVVSTVYLLGNGFKDPWMKQSLAFLCRTRKVFQGSNLFSKGATLAVKSRLKKGEDSDAFLLLDGDKLRYNVGLTVMERGKEQYWNVLEGGSNWYEARAVFDCILESSHSFNIRLTPLAGGAAREQVFSMDSLPEREARTTRLEICMEMTAADNLRVTATDMGFGEYQEPSGLSWSADYTL